MTTPRFGTSVCWTPMQLIATVTTYRKKASLTTPRFGTSMCWTPIATDSNSNHLSEKSVTDHPQIWDLRVLDHYSNSNHLSEKSVNDHPQIWDLCVLDPYSN